MAKHKSNDRREHCETIAAHVLILMASWRNTVGIHPRPYLAGLNPKRLVRTERRALPRRRGFCSLVAPSDSPLHLATSAFRWANVFGSVTILAWRSSSVTANCRLRSDEAISRHICFIRVSIPAPLKIGGLFVFLCRGCDVRTVSRNGEQKLRHRTSSASHSQTIRIAIVSMNYRK